MQLILHLIRACVEFLEAYNFVARDAFCKRIESSKFWGWTPPQGCPVRLFTAADVLKRAMSFLRIQEILFD